MATNACASCGANLLKKIRYCPGCGRPVIPPEPFKPHTGLVVYVIGIISLLMTALTSPPALEQIALATADPDMAELATSAGMNDHGKRLFLRNHPVVSADISTSCAGWLGDSATLDDGCYDDNTHRIYIRDLPDTLNGIEVSTAAHEMLHAAYVKLDPAEKQRINDLLLSEAEKLNDSELSDRLQEYERTMPGSTSSELHSILPSEYERLSPDLETYYSRYFHDRQLSVRQNQQAIAHFTDLEKQIETLEGRIKEAERAEAQVQSLHAIAAYNADRRRITQYAAELDKATAEIDRLTKERDQVQQRYDDLSAEYGVY